MGHGDLDFLFCGEDVSVEKGKLSNGFQTRVGKFEWVTIVLVRPTKRRRESIEEKWGGQLIE